MAKGILCILLVVTMLFGGCSFKGGSTMEEALAFRSKVLSAGGCSFLGEVTADYGDEVYTFALSCDIDADGNLSFTVTAPDTISGITGTVSGDTGSLTFDDKILAFDPMAEGQISPVAAAHTAVQSWRTGYIATCGRENGQLVLSVETSFEQEPLVVDTWIHEEKGVPLFSEICYNGRKLLSVAFTDFKFSNKAE